MKYTLYHIKGKKWGCTTRLNRRLRDQGYSIEDVYETETYNDIDIAADREKELNLECGYDWNDRHDFRIVSNMGKVQGRRNAENGHMDEIRKKVKYTREQVLPGAIAAGKIQGKKNVESGHLKSIARLGGLVAGNQQRDNMKAMATK